MTKIRDKDPDIVQVILSECKKHGLEEQIALAIENKICLEYGGREFYVRKNKSAQLEQKRQRIFADGVTQKTTEEITREHGISRATLYRYMKRG